MNVTIVLIVQFQTLIDAKAVIDQKAEETLNINIPEQGQKRIGYDYPAPAAPVTFDEHQHHIAEPLPLLQHETLLEEHHHDHEEHHDYEEHHDPGYWKKKLIWKEGWKKIWKPGKKQIWKPDWKKIWKPIWVPTEIPVWKDIQIPAWKQIWKPVWKEIQVPAWKEI
uniref:Uncharacterized protein n=1 Tax=Anopheles maculatus TaxID=74869 RepID=A0A182SUY6_9DIPT